jgi:hypothetical protein
LLPNVTFCCPNRMGNNRGQMMLPIATFRYVMLRFAT